eukprot:3862379-Prymnesium_polylepis.2
MGVSGSTCRVNLPPDFDVTVPTSTWSWSPHESELWPRLGFVSSVACLPNMADCSSVGFLLRLLSTSDATQQAQVMMSSTSDARSAVGWPSSMSIA